MVNFIDRAPQRCFVVVMVSERPLPSERSRIAGWPFEYGATTAVPFSSLPSCQNENTWQAFQGIVLAYGLNRDRIG